MSYYYIRENCTLQNFYDCDYKERAQEAERRVREIEKEKGIAETSRQEAEKRIRKAEREKEIAETRQQETERRVGEVER